MVVSLLAGNAVFADGEKKPAQESEKHEMSPAVEKVHEQIVAAINGAIGKLEAAADLKAFSDPKASTALEQLSGALMELRAAHKGGFPVPGGEAGQLSTQKLGFRNTLNMRNLLAEMDFKVCKLTLELLTRMMNGELPKRYNTLSTAVPLLDEKQYVVILSRMDQNFAKFIQGVEEMGREKKTDVYGTALLASSKLDMFCDSEMRLKPYYDNILRVIDRYTEQIKEDELRKCHERFTDMMETCEKLNVALDEARIAFYNNKAPPVLPNDRELLKKLLDSYLKFWGGSQETATKAKELIKTAYDTSTNVGKLRANKGIGKGALLYGEATTRFPEYHKMITRGLEQGRKYYLSTANKYILRIWR
jgi:hypothetical protein